jgi:hypothetical protein
MDSSYKYTIFIKFLSENSSSNPEPEIPEDFKITCSKLDDKKEKGWSFDFEVGVKKIILEEFIEWLKKDYLPNIGKYKIFDPHQGKVIDLKKEKFELIDSILKHDHWVLNNIGGQSASSYEHIKPTYFNRKVVLMFYLLLILVGVYLLANFSLDLFFSSLKNK